MILTLTFTIILKTRVHFSRRSQFLLTTHNYLILVKFFKKILHFGPLYFIKLVKIFSNFSKQSFWFSLFIFVVILVPTHTFIFFASKMLIFGGKKMIYFSIVESIYKIWLLKQKLTFFLRQESQILVKKI